MALNGNIFAFYINGFYNPLNDSVLPPPSNFGIIYSKSTYSRHIPPHGAECAALLCNSLV